MRKTSILVLVSILVLSFTLISSASSDVKVVVNGEGITFPDATPYINEDSRTLVPVRFIAENLGCSVDWKDEIRQVGIEGRGKDIKLNIGENKASVDGKKIEFDTKAIIKDDRTFVPLRFVSEALEAKVEWNGDTRTVFISTQLNVAGKSKIIEELKKYETNHESEKKYKNIEIANERTIEVLGEKDYTRSFNDAVNAIKRLYNKDYRTINETYKKELLYYFGDWRYYKDKKYEPQEFLEVLIQETKEKQIVQKVEFITDKKLGYLGENGYFRVRGRLKVKYDKHDNMSNVKYELFTDSKLEQGKWYVADVEVILYRPVTNAQITWDTAKRNFDTIEYITDFVEVE